VAALEVNGLPAVDLAADSPTYRAVAAMLEKIL
jgi:hypothetical protein